MELSRYLGSWHCQHKVKLYGRRKSLPMSALQGDVWVGLQNSRQARWAIYDTNLDLILRLHLQNLQVTTASAPVKLV